MSRVTDEQCVLGTMLLSKAAIADVIEVLPSSAGFELPAHRMFFDRILDLYRRGEPADPVTVVQELSRRGELVEAGGAAYLHELISTPSNGISARYYAHLVAEANFRDSL